MGARARILITGLVQGVFFRREMTDLARRLGIYGWVRNLPDGKVEALAEGERARLDELIRFCPCWSARCSREKSRGRMVRLFGRVQRIQDHEMKKQTTSVKSQPEKMT